MKHNYNRDMLIENKDLGKKSTIQISEDLRNALKDLGKKRESYENVLWTLVHNKDRRHGDLYNIEELKKINKELIDETLEYFNNNLQDLEAELDLLDEEIDTEEIRSIMVAIEQLCDELDDLSLENEPN